MSTTETTLTFSDLDGAHSADCQPNVTIPATMKAVKDHILKMLTDGGYPNDVIEKVTNRPVLLRTAADNWYRVGVTGFGCFGYIDVLPEDYTPPDEG